MAIKQKTGVSKLADSLFDSWTTGAPSITDAEIAESVGIELKGGLRDLPYLAMIADAREKSEALRSEFESALEEELANVKEQMLNTAKFVAGETVQNALGRITTERMKMPYYTDVDARAIERDGIILISVDAQVLTGHTVYNPSTRSRVPHAGSRDDARYMAGRLQGMRIMGFDSVEGLELKREGRPTVGKAGSPVRVSRTNMAYPDTCISVTYSAEISVDMLLAIYAKHSTTK